MPVLVELLKVDALERGREGVYVRERSETGF